MKKLIPAILLLLVGCAATAPWKPAQGPYRDEARHFSADLPGDWMRFNSKDVLLLSRDGVLLQVIVIERIAAGEERSGSAAYREGMAAAEAAQAMIDRIKNSLKAPAFEVMQRQSAEVSNLAAVRVLYTYRDAAGLPYQGIAVAVPRGKDFYSLHYVAPKRHYFEHDLAAFEKVVKSVRLQF